MVIKIIQEWFDIFEGKGMFYVVVNDVLIMLIYEYIQVRNMVVEVEYGDCGFIKLVNILIKYFYSKLRV